MTDGYPEPARGPVLDGHLVVDRGSFHLDVKLHIDAGEVVGLLGPNGAGKTTALRALAGLQPLTAGHVTLAGKDVDRPGRRVWTPTERRPIGVVFQDYLLFPHLTALDNVAFGPRRHGVDRRSARRQAADWLSRVGLADHARKKPRQLSGGQAQRVALARALAVHPVLLLLDEPLAALDARTRLDTRAELHRHLANHPGATLLVTHDPLDALVLADRLVIIEDGQVVQEGDATTITGLQRHGDNLRVQLAGPIPVAADITPAAATHLRLAPGQPVWVAVKATETRAYPAATRTTTHATET